MSDYKEFYDYVSGLIVELIAYRGVCSDMTIDKNNLALYLSQTRLGETYSRKQILSIINSCDRRTAYDWVILVKDTEVTLW